MNKAKILLIEDEEGLHETACLYFNPRGYEIISAYDGKTGIEQATLNRPDIILLDLGMPGMDGTDVCRMLKGNPKTAAILIIIITARIGFQHEIEGMNIGADDFITKPLRMDVLEARIKRRLAVRESLKSLESLNKKTPEAQNKYRFGRMNLNPDDLCVYIGKRKINMTHTEYKLLSSLIKTPKIPVKYEELYKSDSAKTTDGIPDSLQCHIANIRKKIRAKGFDIKAHYKLGYSLIKTDKSSKDIK